MCEKTRPGAIEQPVVFTLNGSIVETKTRDDRRVIDLLRQDLALTGSKEGCGTGECGACTIVVDGEPKLACLMLVAQLEGRVVETVEALEHTEEGQRLIIAFAEEGAVQCGYCTPGMEMASLSLVRRGEVLTREQIREGLAGNLCRCTGYVKIVDAVERAVKECEAP
jgi:carbon-monoxide dehydrogenase small subunit